MDKNSAINLIDKTFNKAFDEARFTNFIQNLLNDFEIKPYKASGNTIWEDQRDHVSYYKRIGKYIDPEGEALDVLIVQVKNVSKLERARTALRNFVIKHLNNFEKDYALVAFYSKEDEGFDWRFSFIKMEHQSYLDEEKQKVKMRKEFTPAKRYSFLVGKYEKSHTAKTQLLPLLQNIANNPTISELEKAFSIERVTDEFFEQYKSLYIKVYEYFEKQDLSIFQDSQLDASGFTKKLLGQIVFLYFLQKKGWLGVPKNERWGAGKRHFLQQLFDESLEKNKNFFKDYLQYLFYEALAKERDNDNSFYPRFNCRIPFLNGGLFEAQYDWQNANISIPTDLFRNNEKNKSGDIGTGILDVFDRYNFTIKEDEPLDKEVAVDPEMLGKVFENMLEIKERKSKGAFYTPREIVHYMCQESLIHYLDNALNNYNNTYQELGDDQTNMFGNQGKTGQQTIQAETNEIIVPKEDIEQYIREGHLALENDVRVAERGETKTYKFLLPESVRNNADVIDKKLTEIRICDPAIGSGAFPVGLLHELVTAQLILKPHLSYNYLNNKLKEFEFHERESVSESRYVYRLKKHIIQESIYGVDIDRSAIDIARLRLWLSLVVDEDDLEPIETLPNLDYKIVCGNSLIGMPDGTMRDLEVEKELETLKEEFYAVTNEQRKKTLRNKINTKIRELLDTAETFAGYKIDFDFKLFFSEVWREKGGFDAVIANPPYGAKLTKEEKVLFKNQYSDVHMRTPDTFNYFISNGLRLLKEDGVINFIVPNNLLFQSEYEKTRKLLLNKNSFHIGINLGDGVFNTATVPSCIFLTTKDSRSYSYKYADLRNADKKNLDFKSIFSKTTVSSTLQVPASVFGISESEFEIIKKLKSVSVTIDDIAEEMASGISTGGDKIFRIKTDFAKENQFEDGILKKVLKGGEINKYKIENSQNILIYTNRSVEIDNYPNIKDYLLSFKDKLMTRSESKSGTLPWFALGRQRYPELFEEPKIIMRQTSDSIKAVFDDESYYVLNSILVFKKKSECSLSYEYILSILNSTVNAFLYDKFSQEGGRTFAEVKPKNVRKLYVPETGNEEQINISIIVDYLSFVSKFKNAYVEVFNFFELALDATSFELFLPNEFKSTNKFILKHLSDLKPINDSMSEEEKLGIIQSEYERLYHPDHPVRFAIETLDSIEEVRIIREALK
ncbi:Eco57I restriction-modification methylase domain-containing protein [Winogradskyella algicola]|uniref:Eco57I restriction-modification methylase domain-containing protein n=1 Tax=Winogradskyella algicola TaxID=2575815 RepID=UPI001107B462|nr:N-6 DNA methylase [Winogradskyella algicola]